MKIDLYFFVIYDVKKNLKIKPFLLNMYIRTKVVDSFFFFANESSVPMKFEKSIDQY